MHPSSSGAMPTLPFHNTTFHSSHSCVTSSEGWAGAFASHWTGSPFCPTAAPFQSHPSTGRQTCRPGALSRHMEEPAQRWHSRLTQLEECHEQSQFTTYVRLSQSYLWDSSRWQSGLQTFSFKMDFWRHTDYRMCLGKIAGYGAAKAEYPSPTKISLLWAKS